MKLSYLYTEQVSLTENLIDQIKRRWTKRKSPTQIAVDQAFDMVIRSKPIMDLKDDERKSVQNKLIAYKPTLVRTLHNKRSNVVQLAQEMMAKRAARYVRKFQQYKKDYTFEPLGLKRDWSEHGWYAP